MGDQSQREDNGSTFDPCISIDVNLGGALPFFSNVYPVPGRMLCQNICYTFLTKSIQISAADHK